MLKRYYRNITSFLYPKRIPYYNEHLSCSLKVIMWACSHGQTILDNLIKFTQMLYIQGTTCLFHILRKLSEQHSLTFVYSRSRILFEGEMIKWQREK